MKEIFTNPFVLSTLLGIVLLILPSPLVRTTGNKGGNAIEEGGKKARNIAYKLLNEFAEGLKNSEYNGNINLTSNDQIDSELNKYRISLGLMESKSKEKK
ncbi:hypothetical protein NRK67_03115 [Fusobacteria bacterium ZRK30]|nr:hypothetical protein NRK67_03115 [Fusobacteria bacterium ZRK30]